MSWLGKLVYYNNLAFKSDVRYNCLDVGLFNSFKNIDEKLTAVHSLVGFSFYFMWDDFDSFLDNVARFSFNISKIERAISVDVGPYTMMLSYNTRFLHQED